MAADLGNTVVLGIDPGQTTGFCAMGVEPVVLLGSRSPGDALHRVITDQPGSILHYGQIDCTQDENHGVNRLLDLMLYDYPECAVVIEDFIVDFNKITKHRSALSPVRITAKIEFGLWSYDPSQTNRIFFQMPHLAKTTCNDARLKEWGFYDSHSGPHARDAMRHSYYYLRNCRGNSAQAKENRWRTWPKRFPDPASERTPSIPVVRKRPVGERITGLG